MAFNNVPRVAHPILSGEREMANMKGAVDIVGLGMNFSLGTVDTTLIHGTGCQVGILKIDRQSSEQIVPLI